MAGLINCMRVWQVHVDSLYIRIIYIHWEIHYLYFFFFLFLRLLDYPICPYICLFFHTFFFKSTFLGGGNHVKKKVARQAPPPFHGFTTGAEASTPRAPNIPYLYHIRIRQPAVSGLHESLASHYYLEEGLAEPKRSE